MSQTATQQPTGPRPVRLLAVDDQAPFRAVMRALVALTPGFELVGESEDGESALELARRVDPDLVVMDVRMPGLDGIETARRLSAANPACAIVLVSSSDIREFAGVAESCGAAALLDKQRLTPRLLRSLWIALRRR